MKAYSNTSYLTDISAESGLPFPTTESGVPFHTDAPLHNRPGTTINLGVHHDFSGAAAGKIVFRPIEGRFALSSTHDISKMHLYYINIEIFCPQGVKLGWHSGKTSVAKMEGNNAEWGADAISLKVCDQLEAKLKIKDKAGHFIDKTLGHAHIHLKDILLNEKVAKWVPIMNKNQLVGEVLLRMKFHPQTPGM